MFARKAVAISSLVMEQHYVVYRICIAANLVFTSYFNSHVRAWLGWMEPATKACHVHVLN